MPENDVIALDLHYKHWLKTRTQGLSGVDPFEFFCADLFLRPYILSDAEVIWGLVDKSQDGGIDAFYFFLDRILVDDNTEVDPRMSGDVNLVIMQMKERKGFSPVDIDKFYFFTDDLLHIGRQPHEYHTQYHEKLANLMRIFKDKFQHIMGLSTLSIDYYFITRNDSEPGPDAVASGKKVCAKATECFPKAGVKPFQFINAERLWAQAQIRPLKKKSLQFIKSFDSTEGWAGLVTLQNFYEFVVDKSGESPVINENFLEENVRGYQLDSAVNKKITSTLENPDSPEFWVLNNGITILTPHATPGLNSQLEIRDPQIVNGLQTSRKIVDYFNNEATIRPNPDNRRILVKVIQTSDEATRDEIIRATNDQNKMPAEALISTYRIQRQIEKYFEDNGLFYDRRKGHYKARGEQAAQIISVIDLVQAVVSILLKRPDDARGRPRDYVKQPDKRRKVFGTSEDEEVEIGATVKPHDLHLYLQCVRILRKIDGFLDSYRLNGIKVDSITKRNVRFYMARYAAAAAVNNAHCPPNDVKTLDIESVLTPALIEESYKRVLKLYANSGGDDDAAKSKRLTDSVNKSLVASYSPPNTTRRLFPDET